MLVSLGLICLSFSLQGCGPTPKPAPAAKPRAPLEVLGAPCNVVTAEGCNPIQLPLVPTAYNPQCSSESSKCWFHLQPEDNASLVYDETEERSEDISAELAENIQQVSRSNTWDFGIAGVVPILDYLAFSAGVQYREVSKEMDLYGTEQFLATVQRRHIVYSASLSSAAREKLTKHFRDSVDALPENPASDEDYVKWFHFFERFGTHYVKKVSYGGVMRMSLFLKSSVKEDARIKQDNWKFYLQLTFAKLAGIKFPFGPGHSEEEFEAFHHYTLNQHFFAKGGNESDIDDTKWLVTLKAKPAPVQLSWVPSRTSSTILSLSDASSRSTWQVAQAVRPWGCAMATAFVTLPSTAVSAMPSVHTKKRTGIAIPPVKITAVATVNAKMVCASATSTPRSTWAL